MLTDYLSEKQVLIEGKPRGGGVLPWEPVYLTTSILECILECTHKQERGVIATFLSFLKYIESELVREIDRCGIDLIKKILIFAKSGVWGFRNNATILLLYIYCSYMYAILLRHK